MTRVALVSYDFPEYCVRLAGALSRNVQMMLMLPDREAEPFLNLLDPAVDYRPFPKPRLRQPWGQLRTVGQILGQIRAFRPDLVHFQHGHFWFSPALPLLRGYPLVLTLHDARHHVGDRSARHTPQPIMDFGYRRADRLIVHGARIKQEVTERLCIPGERIHVVPLIEMSGGLEPGDGDGDGGAQKEPVVLFFGRIWEYKGLEYLIKAEPAITSQVPEARIVIAGRGEEFDRYRRMMVHPERFEVHNERVSDSDAAELFRRASVVALPYVEASQSAVIPVAYKHARPVVATTVGSLPEAVEDGETGLLVPPRDEEALASAIVKLLRDDELRRRMGANGKRKIESEGSPEAVAIATLAVYQELLGGRVAGDVASGARDASERSVTPDLVPHNVASGLVPDVIPVAHEYPPPTMGDATSQIPLTNRPLSQAVARAPRVQPTTAVALRRFPYPYCAALAICSDIDETGSIEEFLEIQRFLNTKEQTSMGEGLGLEIGNSLFFHDKGGTLSFNGSDDRARGILIDLMRAGYVDCLHSYGDRATKREEALEALETLDRAGCKLDVWINHFGAPSNLSRKFEHRFGPCDGGDPATQIYHADATIDYGIRFAWVGAIARVIGQSPARRSAAFSTLLDGRYPTHSLADLVRETGKWLVGRQGDERYAIQCTNELTRPLALEDGRRLHEFLRYGNHPDGISLGATSRGLAYAIDGRALDQLKAVEGFSIVYTHLGKNSDSEQVIHPTTRAALLGLEREYREGRVFVTTTSRLLNYHLAWSRVTWFYRQADGRTDIFVDSLVDPAFGPQEPTESRLQGVTFYVPDSNRARLYLRGKEVEGIRRNPADHTGSESVTMPVIPLTFPW